MIMLNQELIPCQIDNCSFEFAPDDKFCAGCGSETQQSLVKHYNAQKREWAQPSQNLTLNLKDKLKNDHMNHLGKAILEMPYPSEAEWNNPRRDLPPDIKTNRVQQPPRSVSTTLKDFQLKELEAQTSKPHGIVHIHVPPDPGTPHARANPHDYIQTLDDWKTELQKNPNYNPIYSDFNTPTIFHPLSRLTLNHHEYQSLIGKSFETIAKYLESKQKNKLVAFRNYSQKELQKMYSYWRHELETNPYYYDIFLNIPTQFKPKPAEPITGPPLRKFKKGHPDDLLTVEQKLKQNIKDSLFSTTEYLYLAFIIILVFIGTISFLVY